MAKLWFNIPNVCWTRALFDGSVKVEDFPIEFEAAVFDASTSKRLRGAVEEQYAATEQVLTDYIVRASKEREKNLVALPIFVTRGMVHRKLVTRREGILPKDLSRGKIAMGRVLGATSVFLRGLLNDEFQIERNQPEWIAAEPLTSDPAIEGEWSFLSTRWNVRPSELIPKLRSGDINAVLYPGGAGGHWFNWLMQGNLSSTPDPYGDLETIVKQSSDLQFPIGDVGDHLNWFRRSRAYPLYHCLAIRRELAEKQPGLASALVKAFDDAAAAAPRYLSQEEIRLYERELELLNEDPNRCGLTPLNVRSVQKCIDDLNADGLLPRRPSVNEIFPAL